MTPARIRRAAEILLDYGREGKSLHDELLALAEELEKDGKDAERYQWLRATSCQDNREHWENSDPRVKAIYGFIDATDESTADAAIDAAMAEPPGTVREG